MNQPKKSNRRPIVFDRTTIITLVVFVILSIGAAFAVYNIARSLVSSWSMTSLEGLPVPPKSTADSSNNTGGNNDPSQPATTSQPVSVNTPEPWDGVSRVTVLLMGLDFRDWEAGETPRTDTMILLSMDPLSKTAAIMSIPRDLWVNIPGFDYNKINTGYYLGEAYNLPGGGPALAVETVEQFLGVPIDYYAQVDFAAFVRFIDEIEGVSVKPEMDVKLVPIGDTFKQTLKAGVRVTLPGDLALAYARARYTEGGDFDRARRQQEVIFSIRDRILDHKMLPKLIKKAPAIYQDISGGIKTDLSLDQAFRLATFALSIDRSNIKSYVIDSTCVTFGFSPDAQEILIPIPDKIRLLRDEAFTTGGPIGPAANGENGTIADISTLVKNENARVSIQNGSWMTGLASSTATYLKNQGFNIIEEVNGQASDVTTVYLYNGKPYTVQSFFNIFSNAGLNNPRLYNKTDLSSAVDIVIVLGNDWANYVSNNPLQ
jgi:LCP family protein required for cell wall assembly